MAQYGMVGTPDVIKQQLRQENRDYYNRLTWQGAENALADTAAYQAQALRSDVSEAMNEAYMSSRQNLYRLNASGLVGEQRKLALQQNQQALEEAYNTYASKYREGLSQVSESYIEGMQQIDEALTAEATNIANYRDRHFDYLQYLYEQYKAGKNQLFDNPQWAKYLNEDGTLKTKEQLMGQATDEQGNLVISPDALYDKEGNLTLAGADFFDQLENQPANFGMVDTWGSFLADTNVDYLMGTYGYTQAEAEKVAAENAELLKWSQEYNPYDYTEAGTHGGTFKTLYGMTSTDYTYSFAERLGGLDEGSISKLYSKFEDKAKELADLNGKDKAATITKSISGMVDEIKTLTQDLGIDKALEEEGLNWDDIKSIIVQYQSQVKSGGEMAGEWLGAMGASTVGGLVTGTSIGSWVGSSAGTLGTAIGGGLGLIAGTIIGGIVGIITASIRADEQRKQNLAVSNAAREMFNDVLVKLTNYTANMKRQKDIEWAARNA